MSVDETIATILGGQGFGVGRVGMVSKDVMELYLEKGAAVSTVVPVAAKVAQHTLKGLRRICLDKMAWARHHRYLTIVTDLDSCRIFWIGNGREARRHPGVLSKEAAPRKVPPRGCRLETAQLLNKDSRDFHRTDVV